MSRDRVLENEHRQSKRPSNSIRLTNHSIDRSKIEFTSLSWVRVSGGSQQKTHLAISVCWTGPAARHRRGDKWPWSTDKASPKCSMRNCPSDIWPTINTRTAVEQNQELAGQNPTSHSLCYAATIDKIRHSIGLPINKIVCGIQITPNVKHVLQPSGIAIWQTEASCRIS